MSNILFLESPQVLTGLDTMTYTVKAAGLFNVKVETTVTPFSRTGDGAGSGTGVGSGAGGGAGFNGTSAGGTGLGNGGVGQGFGPGSGYQQPPAYGSNETSVAGVSSGLVITITQNGSNIYTSPAFNTHDFTFQFKQIILCAVNDVINVVFSSSAAPDLVLNSIKSTISIGSGQN